MSICKLSEAQGKLRESYSSFFALLQHTLCSLTVECTFQLLTNRLPPMQLLDQRLLASSCLLKKAKSEVRKRGMVCDTLDWDWGWGGG